MSKIIFIFVHFVKSNLTLALNLEGNTLSVHTDGIVSMGLAIGTVKGHSLLKKIVNTLPDLHFARLMTDRELLIINFFPGHSTGLT